MKVLLFVLLTLGVNADKKDVSWAKFSLLANTRMALSTNKSYGCTLGKEGPTCLDCQTIVLCNSNGDFEEAARCQDVDSRTPFCDVNVGQCQVSDTCPPVVRSMDCKYRGFFPNPMDCSKFLYCESEYGQSMEISCPMNTVYDHAKKICSEDLNSCRTFSAAAGGLCEGKARQFVPHPVDPSVYVVCPDCGDARLRSCNSPNEMVEGKSWSSCKFTCPAQGFFPDVRDRSKYYVCVKNALRLVAYPQQCPMGTMWNDWNMFCESWGSETIAPGLP